MKKLILTLAVSASTLSLFAQGTVDFNNRNTAGGFFAPVYGPESGNAQLSKTGNSAAGLPAGTQVYTGALLTGSGYRAILFAGPQGSAEGALTAASASSTFRTGTSAGAFAGITVTVTGVAATETATAQVRVWDNTSGLYPDWASAQVAWAAGLINAGKSALFDIALLGGGVQTPPQPTGMRSFNIYSLSAVPEPSTFVLAGLGAAGLLIFRRRK